MVKIPRLAIVGGGPAGFYTALRVLGSPVGRCTQIDIYERKPVPFGLSRYGVAPDHPEVKNCEQRFSEVAEMPNVRFLGNVAVGSDVAVASLMSSYDAVVFSYGAQHARQLGIPGEQHAKVVPSREFVGWYNGDPDNKLQLDLSNSRHATVIGTGNVALDVARMLLLPASELWATDASSSAVAKLTRSAINHVDIVARRGPVQAAFTTRELRELINASQCKMHAPEPQLGAMPEGLPRVLARRLKLLYDSAQQSDAAASESHRSWKFVFGREPVEIAETSDGTLDVTWRINKYDSTDPKAKAEPTEEFVKTNTDLVLSAVGYRSSVLPGFIEAGLPFDVKRGIIPSSPDGRVADTNAFAVGWVKTGPTGVIASTMADSFAVGDAVVDYLSQSECGDKEGASKFAEQLDDVVDWQQWKQIDAAEIKRGEAVKKPRDKFLTTEEMLHVAKLG